MNVVIIGGNDKMVRQYKDTCGGYNLRAKVFTQMSGAFRKKIGSPDLMILFTGTVSHKMVISATEEAKNANSYVARSHSSSISALKGILDEYCLHCKNKGQCPRLEMGAPCWKN